MTPERAKELAEANGCGIGPFPPRTGYYVAWRKVGRYYKHGPFLQLEKLSEADFIANLPDKRD